MKWNWNKTVLTNICKYYRVFFFCNHLLPLKWHHCLSVCHQIQFELQQGVGVVGWETECKGFLLPNMSYTSHPSCTIVTVTLHWVLTFCKQRCSPQHFVHIQIKFLVISVLSDCLRSRALLVCHVADCKHIFWEMLNSHFLFST